MPALDVGTFTVSMTANDLDKSLKFYVDGLGFGITREFEKDGKRSGVMLNAGQANLAISQDDFSKGKDRPKGVAMSLYFETTQDVAAVANRLKAAGFTLLSGPEKFSWGPTGFVAADPDGWKCMVATPM